MSCSRFTVKALKQCLLLRASVLVKKLATNVSVLGVVWLKHTGDRTWNSNFTHFTELCFEVTYGQTRWWQTGSDVDKLLMRWRFPGRGYMTLLAIKTQGWIPFTDRIIPIFNLTLLLLQALDAAYWASHCRRLTELLHTIWHTTPVKRLFSTAQPSWVGQRHLNTDEVSRGSSFYKMLEKLLLMSLFPRDLVYNNV